MLDPNALGTAFDIHWQLVHSVTFIEQYSGPQGRRRCLAAGVLDIWHGTDPPDLGTARHGTSLLFSIKRNIKKTAAMMKSRRDTSKRAPAGQQSKC